MARILLVEDDDSVRTFVARALTLDCHEVQEACDGEEAIECFVRSPEQYELVLSDIQMPAMDGIALACAVARARPGQRILLMTGYANQRERAGELEGIILDVVQKPFSLPEIRKRVAAALAA